MTETSNQNDPLIGRNVVDNGGSKIGTVADVYVDDQTGQPAWLAVTTGLFGTKVSFVPLQDAELYGDDVVVAYEKSLVKDAPRAEADGHLSPEDEAALYAHYSQSLSGDVDVAPSDAGRSQPGGDADTTTGIDSDVAMTRSEEELDVNTRTQEAGRVRLRKWVETEDVTIRVPVRREKARLVTEPITDADDDANVGGDLTSDEHEVVLREEVVDVEKRVVPKERVRLETEVETGEVVVDDEVRKERVEMDQDVDTQRDSS